MQVSFTGNLYAIGNSYSINDKKGKKIESENAINEDIYINADQVAYAKRDFSKKGRAELHMTNGDVITLNHPNGYEMYRMAQQLKPSKTIGFDYDSEEYFINNFDMKDCKKRMGIKI